VLEPSDPVSFTAILTASQMLNHVDARADDEAQLEFFGRTFATTVRRLPSMKKKMDTSNLPQDDELFAAVKAAVQSLYVECEVTYERAEAS